MENRKIVKCPCGRDEYWDEMIWKNGIQWCRACTYQRWEKETSGSIVEWHPGENDKTFPD